MLNLSLRSLYKHFEHSHQSEDNIVLCFYLVVTNSVIIRLEMFVQGTQTQVKHGIYLA